jgi:hypothetical protein
MPIQLATLKRPETMSIIPNNVNGRCESLSAYVLLGVFQGLAMLGDDVSILG